MMRWLGLWTALPLLLLLAGCSNNPSHPDGGVPPGDFAVAPGDTAVASYTVGGTVSGLTGSGLVLQNGGGDNLAVAQNGPFTFATALADGMAYDVSVLAQPSAPQ